jgi:hypothetical protein
LLNPGFIQPAVDNSPAFFTKLLWVLSAIMRFGSTATLG